MKRQSEIGGADWIWTSATGRNRALAQTTSASKALMMRHLLSLGAGIYEVLGESPSLEVVEDWGWGVSEVWDRNVGRNEREGCSKKEKKRRWLVEGSDENCSHIFFCLNYKSSILCFFARWHFVIVWHPHDFTPQTLNLRCPETTPDGGGAEGRWAHTPNHPAQVCFGG